MPATTTLTTIGLRAWRPANVSSRLTGYRYMLNSELTMTVKKSFCLSCLDQCHINTPADMLTTITVSVCPICGSIGKSGKMSCCGRGGSWFKHCGGGGNTKLHHTWSEGIQACNARSQSKTGIGEELDVGRQQVNDVSQGSAVIAATNTFALASVNTSTLISDVASTGRSTYARDSVPITSTSALLPFLTHTSAGTSVITRGCPDLCKLTVYRYMKIVIFCLLLY